jgi:hypothetical protein
MTSPSAPPTSAPPDSPAAAASAPGAEPASDTRPSPLVAFLLGLLTPDFGFWYARRAPLALGWIVVSVIAWVLVVRVADEDITRVPRAMVAVILGVRIAGAIVASIGAALKPVMERKGYTHAWWMIGFVLVSWVASTSLPRRFVEKRFALVQRVPDDHMTPWAEEKQLVVIDRRGATPVAPGAVVAVKRDDAFEVVRVAVVGRPGGATAEDVEVGACAAVARAVPEGSALVVPERKDGNTCARYARVLPVTDIVGTAVPVPQRPR